MNRPLIFIVVLAVLCSGCSKPRIDATTDEGLEQSLSRVRESLPEGRRQNFDASLATISTVVESGIGFADVGVRVAAMEAAIKRALNGKTGEEVIAYADDLKSGRQHVPPATCGDDNTTGNGQRPPLVVGENVDMSGNSFWRGVSAQFGEPELRRLYSRLNGPDVQARLRRYVCPNPLPSFSITVVLWYEGPYQERGVRLQMMPPLYKKDGRIENGIGYLFEQAVKALDKGPPIDYGYRHPLDDSRAVPHPEIDTYQEPEVRNCDRPDDRPPGPVSSRWLPRSQARAGLIVAGLRGGREQQPALRRAAQSVDQVVDHR